MPDDLSAILGAQVPPGASGLGSAPGPAPGLTPGLPSPPPLGTILNPSIAQDKSSFWESMISAGTREQIGMSPTPGAEQFRIEHPVQGLASQVLPELAIFAIPGIGEGKLLTKAVGAGKLLKYAAEAKESGQLFRAGAASAAAYGAPVFAARQVGSLFAPEEGTFKRTAQRNLTDAAFGGVFSGTLEFLGGRIGARYAQMRPDMQKLDGQLQYIQDNWKNRGLDQRIDTNAPKQDNFNALRSIMETPGFAGDPTEPVVRQALNGLRTGIISEEPTGAFYVPRNMENWGRWKFADDLFKAGVDLNQAGDTPYRSFLPVDWEGMSQYPRLVTASKVADKARLWTGLNDAFEPIERGTWLMKEPNEGPYIVVKRTLTDEAGKNRMYGQGDETPDQYLVLKTTKPHEFITDPSLKSTLKDVFVNDPNYEQLQRSGFMASAKPPLSSAVFEVPGAEGQTFRTADHIATLNTVDKLAQLARVQQRGIYGVGNAAGQLESPFAISRLYGEISQTEPIGVGSGTFATASKVAQEGALTVRDFMRNARQAVAPAVTGAQFRFSPRAQALYNVINETFHAIPHQMKNGLFGDLPDNYYGLKNLMALKDPRSGGILPTLVKNLAHKNPAEEAENLRQFTKIWLGQVTPDEAVTQGMRENVVAAARAADQYNFSLATKNAANDTALGLETELDWMKGHGSISRVWRGSHRASVMDEDGNLIGYGSGYTPQQALDEGKLIARSVNATLPSGARRIMEPTSDNLHTISTLNWNHEVDPESWKLGNELDLMHGNLIDMNQFLSRRFGEEQIKLRTEPPKTFETRTGMLGFKGGLSPLTLKDVVDGVTANTTELYKYMAKRALVSRLMPDVTKLADEAPDMAKQLTIRFNSWLGFNGPIAKDLTRGVNKFMAPTLGDGAAERFADATNRGLFHLTLGSGNLGFLAVQALHGLQKILPEANVLIHAPIEGINDYYMALPVLTKAGMVPVHVWDTAKFMYKGFSGMRELTHGTGALHDELVDAVRQGVARGAIGRSGIEDAVRDMADEAHSLMTRNPINALLNFNSKIISKVEQFSRLWSYLSGYQIARTIRGASPDEAIHTAVQFTRKTMYEYSAAERPRITTGAIGKSWGLFRNFGFQYLSNLAQYADIAAYGYKGTGGQRSFGPLLWAMLGAGAAGGAITVPAYGIASTLSKWLSDKDLTDWTYEAAGGKEWGKHLADGFNYGFPAAFGYTIANRVGAPTSQILHEMSMYASMNLMDRAVGLYKTMGAAWDQLAEGNINVLRDPGVQRNLLQAFAPATLSKAYAVWNKNGLEGKTGNLLVNNLSRTDAWMYALGITPMEVERAFSAYDVAEAGANAQKKMIGRFGSELAEASNPEAYDLRGVNAVMRKAVLAGAPLGSVLNSSATILRNERTPVLERHFKGIQAQEIERLRGF
jgi:hypothetical protein